MAAIEHSTHKRLQLVKIEMRRAKLSDSFVLHILAIGYGGAWMLTGPVPPMLFVTHSGFLVYVLVVDLADHAARLSQIASLQVAQFARRGSRHRADDRNSRRGSRDKADGRSSRLPQRQSERRRQRVQRSQRAQRQLCATSATPPT
jgi:hypothetical protein